MAQDDRTPDFDDLLAAFDIPDVPSVPVKEQDSAGGNAMLGDLHQIDASSHQWNDKSNCDTKAHPQPTSKLTLGITNNSAKRNNSKPALNLKLTASPAKSVPTLTNRNVNRMHPGSNNSVPATPPPTSTNHVVTSTDTTDDATYQLSTNVLPPYVPAVGPPEKFKLTFPLDRYRCSDCGDRFLLETSLVHHLQRRSVYITFNCDGCKKTLIYYNRCNLLNHIRTHREKNQPADVKKADVTPIPRELLNVSSNGVALVNGTSPSNSSAIGGTAGFVVNHDRVVGEATRSKVGVANADGRFRCSECSQFFDNATSLEDHFGRSQNMPLATSQCAKCNMTCPSKCSLAAHQRIHLQSQPFICPECGQKVSDYWNAFQLHLSVKCLHYSRTIGYKCSICLMLHGDGEALRQHIISTHSEAYYKCQACPMAFKAGGTFDTHKKTAHLTMDVQCKMIFKCPLCDTVFHSSEQLLDHLDVHIKEQIRATKFVFRCLECGKLVESKNVLAEHLKEVHPNVAARESCLRCGLVFDGSEELRVHETEAHGLSNSSPTLSDEDKSPKRKNGKGTTQCDECGREFQTGHGFSIHKQRCHSTNTGNLVCFVCNRRFSMRSQLAAHGRSHQEEGLLVCTVCNNHTFESRNGLAKHLDTHAANMKLPALCDHCGETLNDVSGAARHLKTEHGFSSYTCSKCEMSYHTMKSLVRHERTMHNVSLPQQKNYSCPVCKDRVFPKRTLLEKHMKVTHKLSIEISKIDDQPPIKIKIPHADYLTGVTMTEDLPAKKLRLSDEDGGVYVCFKCDFSTEFKDDFRDHIVRHKEERNSLQCNECGACFVVEPSLKKHLTIVHKVKNVDEYLSAEGVNAAESEGESGCDVNGLSGFECRVCFSVFDSELTLKTHMRTHGMAFIRSKRTKIGDSGSGSS